MTALPRILAVLLATLFAAPLWAAAELVFCDMPGMASRVHTPGDDCCGEPAAPVVVDLDECCLETAPQPTPEPAGPCFRCDVPVPHAVTEGVASLGWVGLATPAARVSDLLVASDDLHAGTPFPFVRPPPPTLVGLHAMLTC